MVECQDPLLLVPLFAPRLVLLSSQRPADECDDGSSFDGSSKPAPEIDVGSSSRHGLAERSQPCKRLTTRSEENDPWYDSESSEVSTWVEE